MGKREGVRKGKGENRMKGEEGRGTGHHKPFSRGRKGEEGMGRERGERKG